jgi:hypothetical protein
VSSTSASVTNTNSAISSSNPAQPASSGGSLSGGTIGGIIAGCVVVLVVLIISVLVYKLRTHSWSVRSVETDKRNGQTALDMGESMNGPGQLGTLGAPMERARFGAPELAAPKNGDQILYNVA